MATLKDNGLAEYTAFESTSGDTVALEESSAAAGSHRAWLTIIGSSAHGAPFGATAHLDHANAEQLHAALGVFLGRA